ncbi:MAG TPA: hypothetical protein VFE32_23095 [Puia sp.]|jgi:hypothetical protein|nr:hypothetical protein [Puia sp.]
MHVERPSILCFCLLLNFTLLASVAHGQHVADDSRLYNGREYIRNGIPSKGFACFEWDSLMPGSLEYDGISYKIPLEYDLAQDQLVIHDFAGNTLISLVTGKIAQFSIGPYHFRYFGPGNAHLPESGFYQELYAGSRISLLARRHKNLVFPSTLDEQPVYVQINAYFLLLHGSSYKIANENELLDILKDKKTELKKYIRKNRLSFRRNMEGALIQTIAYYQQIIT